MVMARPDDATLALADRAHEVLAQIVAVGQQMALCGVALGQLLAEVKGDELYRAHGCETFEEFCGLPEVGLSRTQAYRLIQIAQTFGDGGVVPPVGPDDWQQLAAIGVRKLHALVPVVRDHPEQAAEWLDKAEALSASGLQQEIAASRGVERSEEGEWYVRRFRAIQATAQRAIDGTLLPGNAADAICAEAMRIQARAKEQP